MYVQQYLKLQAGLKLKKIQFQVKINFAKILNNIKRKKRGLNNHVVKRHHKAKKTIRYLLFLLK